MLVFDLSRVFNRIRVRGSTRLDFLHRMSTGNLLGLTAGEGRATVFTTPIGRMVDYAIVLAFDDSLLLLSGGNSQGKVTRWLRKYIFFNDDVELSDESETLAMVGVYGDGALEWAAEMHGSPPPTRLYSHVTTEKGILVNAPAIKGAGFYVLGDAIPADSAIPAQVLSPLELYEDLRIRAGYPEFPFEIGEDYIPLEAGIRSAISFSKGCYIGQEIIARMDSRGQLAKRLVRMETQGILQPGDIIRVGGNEVGAITSVTSDGHAALGYLRAGFAKPGQEITAGHSTAHVIDLAGM